MRHLVLALAAAALVAGSASAAPAAKGTSKMSQCAAKWNGMTTAQKDGYKEKAKGMKSKKGGSMSGYNAWTGECMKKAA